MPPPPETELSKMYARWTLDCVVDVAAAIAHDSAKRPRQYRAVPAAAAGGLDAIVRVLSNFRSKLGSDSSWPNGAQRAALYSGCLGTSDGKPGDKSAPFHQMAAAVRDAAVAYCERVVDAGEGMLKQAFIEAATAFGAYLGTMVGSAVAESHRQTEEVFNNAVRVLKTQEIAQAFGLPHVAEANWPTVGARNGDGAALVEEISRALQPSAGPPITQQQFSVMQRIAHQGASTIAGIQDNRHTVDATFKEVVQSAYTWATALRALGK